MATVITTEATETVTDAEDVTEFLTAIEEEAKPRTNQEAETRRLALLALAKLGGDHTSTEDVVFKGRQLILPETMTLVEAISFLRKKREADEQTTEFSRTFKYRPWDGAYCFMEAVKRHFGMMRQVSTMGFFGPNPPRMITVPTGPDTSVQLPWGNVTLPHLPGVEFSLEATRTTEDGLVFVMGAEGPNKYRAHINGVFTLVEEELRTRSLYRGRAIDGAENPGFMDLSAIDKRVVYSAEVLRQLNANVWSLIEHTASHVKAGLPQKRAVLFEGPYGTGKTLAAYLTAEKAEANGWTFLYCRPGRDDPFEVMKTARLYEPSCVFVEDVDTISGTDQDADAVSKLLDAFDGISSKGAKIALVLTTNHADRIHKGMLRPGRLDAMIHVGELDPEGVRRLITAVALNLDPKITGKDWDAITAAMSGFMPAFIREASERAVRYAIAENDGSNDSTITASALIDAANGLRPQLDLMTNAHELSQLDSVDSAIHRVVEEAASNMVFIRRGDDPSEYSYRLAVSPD